MTTLVTKASLKRKLDDMFDNGDVDCSAKTFVSCPPILRAMVFNMTSISLFGNFSITSEGITLSHQDLPRPDGRSFSCSSSMKTYATICKQQEGPESSCVRVKLRSIFDALKQASASGARLKLWITNGQQQQLCIEYLDAASIRNFWQIPTEAASDACDLYPLQQQASLPHSLFILSEQLFSFAKTAKQMLSDKFSLCPVKGRVELRFRGAYGSLTKTIHAVKVDGEKNDGLIPSVSLFTDDVLRFLKSTCREKMVRVRFGLPSEHKHAFLSYGNGGEIHEGNVCVCRVETAVIG